MASQIIPLAKFITGDAGDDDFGLGGLGGLGLTKDENGNLVADATTGGTGSGGKKGPPKKIAKGKKQTSAAAGGVLDQEDDLLAEESKAPKKGPQGSKKGGRNVRKATNK